MFSPNQHSYQDRVELREEAVQHPLSLVAEGRMRAGVGLEEEGREIMELVVQGVTRLVPPCSLLAEVAVSFAVHRLGSSAVISVSFAVSTPLPKALAYSFPTFFTCLVSLFLFLRSLILMLCIRTHSVSSRNRWGRIVWWRRRRIRRW